MIPSGRPARPLGLAGRASRFVRRWIAGETTWDTRHFLGAVEAPAAGATCRLGRLAVYGWAFDRKDPVTAVLVAVDGELRAIAERNLPRPDLAALYPGDRQAMSAGWGAVVPIGFLEPRDVEISVIALRGGRRPLTMARRIVRYLGPPERGALDRPATDAVLRRSWEVVEGWLVPRRTPLARLHILVNGSPAGLARIGVSRPDVAEALGSDEPESLLCGFQGLVDLRSLPSTEKEVEIGVAGTDLDGWPVEGPSIKVRLAPADDRDEAPTPQRLPRRRRPSSADPLRVLTVTHSLERGGGQLYLFELLRRLAGDISGAVVAPRPGSLQVPLERLGFEVRACGDHPWERLEDYEAFVNELAAWADGQFDVALVNTLGAFAGQEVAARAGLPSVWALHESFDLEAFWVAAYPPPGPHPAIRDRAWAALRDVEALVFEAHSTRALFERYVEDPARLLTIRYGVDVAAIERFRASIDRVAARRRLDIPESAFLLLCMGTIEPRKGQTILAQAFRRIAERHPDAMLVFVGSRGDAYSQALDAYVERSGLAPRVRMLPVVSDPYIWYAMADALLFPSDIESMPRAAMEAMAFELPVMGADVFGLSELITDGETGFLHAPLDLGVLIDALDRLLSLEPEERARVGKAGSVLVHDRYDSAGYAAEYRTLLGALADDPAATPSDILGR